jgi:hypothetical protein
VAHHRCNGNLSHSSSRHPGGGLKVYKNAIIVGTGGGDNDTIGPVRLSAAAIH